MQNKFAHAIFGGTFDHFHAGHIQFITRAIEQSKIVTIGLTTKKIYANKPFAYSIESYATRKRNVKKYLEAHGLLDKCSVVPLLDFYGNSLQEENIDVIFVTPETKSAADKINKKRIEKGWQPIKIIIIPFLRGDDKEIISSVRIRKGEIDRLGNTYFSLFLQKNLHLPPNLREKLRLPIGDILKTKKQKELVAKNNLLITIGDIVTASVMKNGYRPAISILDLKSERKIINDTNILNNLPRPDFVVKNNSATIDKNAVLTYQKAMQHYLATKEKQTIRIKGEEDLMTLPAILLSPIDAIVLYGQTGIGAISVHVTEERKAQMKKLIQQFI